MTSINEHQQLHAARATVTEERIERGADRAAGVENVVNQDDIAIVHIEAKGAWTDHRADIVRGKVVAVKANVKHSSIDGAFFDGANQSAQSFRKGNAAALNANQAQVFGSIVLFDDLMGQADERAFDLGGRHDPALLAQSGCGLFFGHTLALAG